MKLYGVTGMKSYFFNVSTQKNLNQNEMNELLVLRWIAFETFGLHKVYDSDSR